MRFLLAATLLTLALPALADSRIERTATWETERPGKRPERTNRRETLWVGDDRVRSDDRVSRESWIVRADKKVIWRIDHALRTYSEVTFEDAAKERAAAADDLRAAIARVAGSDDEPALKKFLDAFAPPDLPCETKETGDGGMVAGQPTRTVTSDSSSGTAVKGRLAAGAKGLDRMAKVLGDAGLLAPRVAECLGKLKGMLLSASWTLVFPDAIVHETFETTKFEDAPSPEGTYDLPAGYRKVDAAALRHAPRAVEAPPGGYEGDRPTEEGDPVEEPTGEEAGKGD